MIIYPLYHFHIVPGAVDANIWVGAEHGGVPIVLRSALDARRRVQHVCVSTGRNSKCVNIAPTFEWPCVSRAPSKFK